MSSAAGLGRPGLAAITFSARGGGIAAVSRLLADVLTDASGEPPMTFTLSRGLSNFDTGLVDRVRFGSRVAFAQLSRRCHWMFYTHLSLATVQRPVPAPFRAPYAVFLHDIEAWTPLSSFRRRVLAGAFLRLANSAYTARRVREANPDCGMVVACPLALPKRDDAAGEARVAFGMGPHAAVIVGRMMANERYKGHDQVIEAWPQVVSVVPDAQLVCVGEGDDVPRLRAKAVDLGIGAQVIFPGFVDDVTRRAIYDRAALLVMPSRREGFGLVYLEAMAARVPCIGSVHDAAADVIVDGQTGYLVLQDDRDGLARRILALLQDESLRRRMGHAGYERYRREFSYEVFRRRVTAGLLEAWPVGGRTVPARTTTGNA